MSAELPLLAARALDLTAVLIHVVRLHVEQDRSRLFYWDRPYIVCRQLSVLLPHLGYGGTGALANLHAAPYRNGRHLYDASAGPAGNSASRPVLVDRILVLTTLLCRCIAVHGKDSTSELHRDTRTYALACQIENLLRQAGFDDTAAGLSCTGLPVDTNPFIDEDLLRNRPKCATAA